MKLFKTTDEKLKEIGFKKIRDNNLIVEYQRYNDVFNYTQSLCIVRKLNGQSIIQSYDKGLFDKNLIGNVCVGLTFKETKLIIKKMKEKGWHK